MHWLCCVFLLILLFCCCYSSVTIHDTKIACINIDNDRKRQAKYTAFKLMVAKTKPMEERKSDNRLRISSFCMHKKKRITIPMWWKDSARSRETKWEMFSGFDFVFGAICVVYWILFLFHFFSIYFCVTHSPKVTHHGCSFNAFGFVAYQIQQYMCILNFKLEMELLKRKMRHDLGSEKRLSAKWYSKFK